MATTSTTSYTSTPQAQDDTYGFTESQLLASSFYNTTTEVITLDVMANDSGGKAKTLFSVDGDMDGLTELLQKDTAGTWETARVALMTSGSSVPIYHDIQIRIYNGKIEVDLTGALGSGTIGDMTADQTLQGSFLYAIQLGNGTKSYATINFSLTGETDSTDNPTQFTGDLAKSLEEADDVLRATGHITAIDPEGFDNFQTQTDVTNPGGYGKFSITASGEWTYVTHTAMDWLTAGQTVTESFTVKAHDGTEQVVSVTITGTDDEPVVTQADITGQVKEGGTLTASGVFTMVDPDNAQGLQLGQWVAGEGAIGTLHVTQTASGTTSTFAWTYAVDATAVEALGLGEGQTATADFSVEVSGMANMGGFAITITIQGTNDVPTITVTPGKLVTEDGTLTTDGKLGIEDPDNGESAFAIPAVLAGTYGNFDFQTDGTWHYTLNNTDARVQALADGATLTDQFSVTSVDGTAYATQQVTITGANDGPTATADTATGSENQTLSVDVLANDTDPDNGDVLTVLSATAPSGKGTAMVSGNMVMFNPGTAFDYLADGQSENVVITYTVKDSMNAQSSSTVTVTVTGTDDGPITRPDSTSGAENDTLTLDVLANDGTPDRIAPLTLVTASVPQDHGSVSIVNNQVVFTPGTDFDHLVAGAPETVTITYTVADEHGATAIGEATIHLTGTNDAPEAHDDNATTSATQPLTIDVLANDTDPDTGDVLTLVGTPTALYGSSVSIVNNKLSFTPSADFANLEPGQFVDERLDYTIQDQYGATLQASVTVRVVSESADNPTEIISGLDRKALFGTVTEATTGSIAPIDGQIILRDLDVGQQYAVSAVGSAYGVLTATISVNADDPTIREIHWTFTADTAAIENLGLDASDIEQLLADPLGNPIIAGTLTLDLGLPGEVYDLALLLKVNGADDDPGTLVSGNISAVLAAGGSKEALVWVASGDLNLVEADSDPSDDFAASQQAGQRGTFQIAANGYWTYTYDGAYAQPASPQGIIDSATIQAADGSSHTLYVTDGAVVSQGTAGNDVMTGTSGADILFGQAGRDRLDAGDGDDRVDGGDGDDILDGGWGANMITGGDGKDWFYFNAVEATDGTTGNVITDFNTVDDKIVLDVTEGVFDPLAGLGEETVFGNQVTYDGTTGSLSFNYGASSFVIATLSTGLTLTSSNLLLVTSNQLGGGSGGGGEAG